ncbi:Lcl C-terminal domain-containing protein [Teredinibacter purpureus]|jgi:Protein of unknown function (DUF1566).|uniref:Lcl C-terminal domain-containing protein n=1 Tax=Teredinibacter purpureus TaxID=2731756 RepID=UPI0009E3159D|nr:DUF1566 domain-containing protein [Teredinibacter purpureus]
MNLSNQHLHPLYRFFDTTLLLCLVGLAPNLLAQEEQHCQNDTIIATAPDNRYVQHNNHTVTDSQTDLTWSQCLLGTTGETCNEGTALELNWAEALIHVTALNTENGFAGSTDWRLPNIRELSTLAELQCSAPAINIRLFPSPARSHVWSSSPYHFYTHYSWYVDFANGAATYDERIKPKMLRLVRDAAAEAI